MSDKPAIKPADNRFSSGPCRKRPGWSVEVLANAILGRSHRVEPASSRLHTAIQLSRELLDLPGDYLIGIVPGSDTGAMEMAMWNLLGARGVDVLAWENFGRNWLVDILDELKLGDVCIFEAKYGELPDLNCVNPDHDVVFTWNGTTSGVKVPDAEWIKSDRQGLTLCDATSAVFAMEIPWDKLDVITYSWQKVLGGEAAHGMLILSPRAVERLESWRPPWPVPKLFRLTKNGKLNTSLFSGRTINTPSMLCVEDYLDTLYWAQSIGGLRTLLQRSQNNLTSIERWVEKTDWIDFLCTDNNNRSNTSVCLKITSDEFNVLSVRDQKGFIKQMVQSLADENVALDINAYRTAPAGLRIWAGATIENEDIEALLPWLEWAYAETLASRV